MSPEPITRVQRYTPEPAATGRVIVRLVDQITTHFQLLIPHTSGEMDLIDVVAEAVDASPGDFPSFALFGTLVGPLPRTRLARAVPPTALRDLEIRAGGGTWGPTHSLLSYWVLYPHPSIGEAELLQQLNVQHADIVDVAYPEPRLRDPSGFEPDLAQAPGYDQQRYLEPNPVGVNAWAAWSEGFAGGGMKFADVEMEWNLNHDDLKALTDEGTLVFGDDYATTVLGPGTLGDHGTRVLGVVLAQNNEVGIVGIASQVEALHVASRYVHDLLDQNGDSLGPSHGEVVSAIVALLVGGHVEEGDVLLLEVDTWSGHPVEVVKHIRDAIVKAVELGVVVVEVAGNGDHNLDLAINPLEVSGWWLEAAPPELIVDLLAEDSGAIIVGAAQIDPSASTVPFHTRYLDGANSSNYGQRVDCYASGDKVYSTALGDSAYDENFAHTSAAASIIAGTALLAQQMQKSLNEDPLSSIDLRDQLLSDPTMGIGSDPAQPIGVMPDLGIIYEHLARKSDVYVRDCLIDEGQVPSPFVSMSPDIFVLRQDPPFPGSDFAEGSGKADQMIPNDDVRDDTKNHVYVRMRNRGTLDATATARVYWSEPGTLISPSTWTLIEPMNNPSPVLVPADDSLVVYGPIQWDARNDEDRPHGNHACFIAIADTDDDPGPDPATIGTLDNFCQFVGRENNVAWRNFDIWMPSSGSEEGDSGGDQVWSLFGFGEDPETFDIEAFNGLPPGCKLWLDSPEGLGNALLEGSPIDLQRRPEKGRVQLLLKKGKNRLGSIRLTEAGWKCRLILESDGDLPPGDFKVFVRQLWRSSEVGRMTWCVRGGRPTPAE